MENLDPRPVILQTNKYLDGDPLGGNVDDFFIADLDTQGDEGTIIITVDLETNTYTVSYRDGAITIDFPIIGATHPVSNQLVGVVIASLLPNPVGSDLDLEEVTIRNDTGQNVSLIGWTLRDQANMSWSLSAVDPLLPGQNVTIIRGRQPMSLNNGGDLIELLDAEGNVHDRFQYWGSSEGVLVETGH